MIIKHVRMSTGIKICMNAELYYSISLTSMSAVGMHLGRGGVGYTPCAQNCRGEGAWGKATYNSGLVNNIDAYSEARTDNKFEKASCKQILSTYYYTNHC